MWFLYKYLLNLTIVFCCRSLIIMSIFNGVVSGIHAETDDGAAEKAC